MSETGATEAQVAMAETLADAIETYFDFGEPHNESRWAEAYQIGLYAAGRLPDHRIVRAADAITPELRAAIGRAVAVVEAATDLCKSGMDTWSWDRQAIEVTTHYALLLAEALAVCSAEQRALLAAVADGGE